MSIELSELLFNALNEQGYLFQEACEQALKDIERRTGWEVRAYEYPVSLWGQDTKVDIVLHAKRQSLPELYALVECKRADPSYIYWLFGAPGLPYRDALCSTLGFKSLSPISSAQPLQVKPLLEQLRFEFSTYVARSWQEVKQDSHKRVSTPQNIENAFGQVLKGVGGFAQEQLHQRCKEHVSIETFFIPVVVTTASLYVAYYETKDVDLSTGKVSKDKVLFGPQGQPAEEDPWVIVDYGVGENVAPEPIPESYHGVDPAELQKHKTRSIFVVNSKSLVDFFSRLQIVQ